MGLPTLPYGTPLEGAAAGEWAVAICRALNAPVTLNNCYSLAGWFRREGGGGQNNPMNTTLGSQYPAINSDGVRNFPTPEIGVAETVATLQDGYSNVVASFRAGTGLGAPNSATAQELAKWSGGGYTSISPVVVPLPAAPSTYHYDWYDGTVIKLPTSTNSERAVCRNYDRQRKHPIIHRLSLRKIYKNLVALVDRVENNEKATDDPKGLKDRRAWRLARLKTRAAGKVCEPEQGSWPQS